MITFSELKESIGKKIAIKKNENLFIFGEICKINDRLLIYWDTQDFEGHGYFSHKDKNRQIDESFVNYLNKWYFSEIIG